MATKKTAAKKAPTKKTPKADPAIAKLESDLAKSKKRLAKPKAPAKAAKKAAPKAPKAKGGTYAEMAANRAHESSVENPVSAMWNLCEVMVENKRKDVIAAAVAKGINYYTARTQYQLWLTAWRNSK